MREDRNVEQQAELSMRLGPRRLPVVIEPVENGYIIRRGVNTAVALTPEAALDHARAWLS